MQSFFESLAGQITTVGVIVLLFLGILFTGKNKKLDVKAMSISALLVALAIILNQLVLFRMPQGGSVTFFCMVPIALCAYLFGVRRGLMAGMCVGLIDLIFSPYVIHPVQLLLDYPLAFGAIAFGGFVASGKYGMVKCYALGVFCRFFCSFLSGVIFFGAYAPEGFNAVTWSIVYNGSFMGVEALASVIVLCIPQVRNLFARLKDQVQ